MTLCLGHKLFDTAIAASIRRGVAYFVSVTDFKQHCLNQSCPAFIRCIFICNVPWPMEFKLV